MEATEIFAVRVRELLELRNMTWYGLAKRSGVPKTTLQAIRDGSNTDVKLETIKKIADGFELSVRDFFDSDLFR